MSLSWDQYEYRRLPLMNDVLDPAYEKLGAGAVNAHMDRLAKALQPLIPDWEIGWWNIKDCSSYMYTDHGHAWFGARRPLKPNPDVLSPYPFQDLGHTIKAP